MPLGDNLDELNIGLGWSGVEDFEQVVEKLERLLQRARTNAEKLFAGPLAGTEEFSAHVTSLEKKVVSLTSQFSSLGKLGSKGFEEINRTQLEAFDRLTAVQRKLQSIDATLSKDVKPSTLVRRKKEAQELEIELQALEKQLLSTRTLDIIQKTYAAPTPKPGRDLDAERARKDIARMIAEREAGEKLITEQVESQAEKQARARIAAFQRYVKDVLSGFKKIEAEEKRAAGGPGGPGGPPKLKDILGPVSAPLRKLGLSEFAQGLGPVAAGVGAYLAIERGLGLAEKAIERASEQARANRTLASSAAEAGISIDFLTKKNKEFAELTALSDVKATTTVAKITQLATLAQTPNNIEKLIKGFANLGAARGLDAQGIETVVQQIITGQDEGYKKLLLPNPAQLQKQYAVKNNRTVESLTAVEKAQIFQAEFLKKAELFNGAAEARLASVDGRAAKLNAAFENLANTLSTKFANNYDTAKFIDGLTKSFTDLNTQIDDLANKVEHGINIDDLIKQQAKPNALLGGVEFVGNTLAATIALAGSQIDAAQTLLRGKNYFKQGGSLSGLYSATVEDYNGQNASKREDFLRQQVNAEIKVRALNQKTEQERKVELARAAAEEEQNRLKDAETKRLTNVFKDPRANAAGVLAGIQNIKNYANLGGFTVEPDKVAEETTKRFNARDVGLDLGRAPEKIRQEIAEQVLKEMQASVDQKNLPLFDAESKRKLIKEGEELLDNLAKKAEELVRNVKEDLVGALTQKTDNPFIKLFADAEDAGENARRKFARLGPELAASMGKIAEASAKFKLDIETFESSDRELKFRQQSRRLEQLPATQTNAFERRLQQVETGVQFQLQNADTGRQINEAQFYTTTDKTGKGRKLREAFLRQQYGSHYDDLISGARGTREEKDAYREVGVRIKESLKDLDRARSVSTQGLGVYARGAVAAQLLDRLPTTEELLPRLRRQGTGREEARTLFRSRGELLRDKQDADEQRFKDFIQNQKFIDLNRKDAEERAKNLFDKGGALPEKVKLDKFLQITDELGPGELTPELRQQRIRALNARADIESREKKLGQEQLKTISDFAELVKKQVEAGGLKVDLAETPIVEVQVNATGVTAELVSRPNSQRSK